MGSGPEQIEREHKGGRRRDGGDKRLRVGFLRESTRAGPSFDGRVSALVRKAAFALRRADVDVADDSLGSVHILTSGPKAQASEAKAR